MDPTHTESLNLEVCEHNISGVVRRPPRTKHYADPQPKYEPPEKVEIGFKPPESNSEDDDEEEDDQEVIEEPVSELPVVVVPEDEKVGKGEETS